MKSSKCNKVWFRVLAACLCMVLVVGLIPVRATTDDGTAAETEVEDVLKDVVPEEEEALKEEADATEEKKEAPESEEKEISEMEEEKSSEEEEEASGEEKEPPEEEEKAPAEEEETSEEEEKSSEEEENEFSEEEESTSEPKTAGAPDSVAVAAVKETVEMTFKVAVTNSDKQQPNLSAFTANNVKGYSNQYIWLYLDVVNTSSEPVDLVYYMNVEWGDYSYPSGKAALRKPKPSGSGSNPYTWTVLSGGEYIPTAGEHDTPGAIRLDASGHVTMIAGGIPIDGTLASGQQVLDTITLTNPDNPNDVVSASVTVEKLCSVKVEQGHTYEGNTNQLHNTVDSEELVIGNSAKFWIKIENISDIEQTFVFNATFAVNGVIDHDLHAGIEKMIDRSSISGNSSNLKGKPTETNGNTEVTLGPGGYIWFASNNSYKVPVGSDGDVITNTITVWVKDEDSVPDTDTLTRYVPGTKAFDVTQEFGVVTPADGSVNWQAGSTIDEDDQVQFRVTVNNLGAAGLAFTLSDIFYINTSSGRGGDTSDSYAPNFVLNEAESTGVASDGSGKYSFTSADGVAVFYAEPYFVPGEGYYASHTTPQVKNTVTATEVGGNSRTATGSVVLNINEPTAKFTVEAALSVNGGGWRTNNKTVTTAQVTMDDGTKADKYIEAMARITNNSRFDLVIDLSEITAKFLKNNSDHFTFSDKAAFVNVKETSEDVTINGNTVTIPYGCTVQVEWSTKYDIDADRRNELIAGDSLALQVTVKNQKTELSANDSVTITIQEQAELHLGYSMSRYFGDFRPDDKKYLREDYCQRKNDDGKYEDQLVKVWKTSDGIEIYDNGLTADDGAMKYMHVISNDSGDEVRITSCVPVSTDPRYTFMCWYDKQARTGNELVLPGDIVIKDSETEHSVDAVWVEMKSDSTIVIYDGQGHGIEAGGLGLAGEDGKYAFAGVVNKYIGQAEYSVTVTLPNGKTESIGAHLGKDAYDLVFDKLYTETGVYSYHITAHFDIGRDEPVKVERDATLTILPRPVVVQVNSASYVYDGKGKTVEIKGATYNLVNTNAYYTNGALAKDVKKVLDPAYVGLYGRSHMGFVKGDSLYSVATVVYGDDRALSKTEVGVYNATIADTTQLKDAATATGNYIFIARDGTLTITAAPETPKKDNTTTPPKTGDESNLQSYKSMFIASGCALTGLLFIRPKKRRKNGAESEG